MLSWNVLQYAMLTRWSPELCPLKSDQFGGEIQMDKPSPLLDLNTGAVKVSCSLSMRNQTPLIMESWKPNLERSLLDEIPILVDSNLFDHEWYLCDSETLRKLWCESPEAERIRKDCMERLKTMYRTGFDNR